MQKTLPNANGKLLNTHLTRSAITANTIAIINEIVIKNLMVSAIIFQLQTALSIEPVRQASQDRLFAYRYIECNPVGVGLGVPVFFFYSPFLLSIALHIIIKC